MGLGGFKGRRAHLVKGTTKSKWLELRLISPRISRKGNYVKNDVAVLVKHHEASRAINPGLSKVCQL